jgi:hypothetical protein
VGALAELIAHGGTAGAIVEALVVLAVVAVFLAVWLRERGTGDERAARDEARLRDDDEPRL